ncbi:MAG: hypothetical protein QG602_397 [Verrucomicrobiota bacterium]|nr:hypothetical protein [Verrucomicrobiota bacterium]
MRLAALLLATLTLTARAAIPLPDVPTVTDLDEFQLTCQSQQATISLLESTGQKDKAAELRDALWERYDAELFARRCQLADLSLTVLNPFLPAEERKAADGSLDATVAEIARLSVFTAPAAAQRARDRERSGAKPTPVQLARAEAHATLQAIRQQLAQEALALPGPARLRRELVARLTSTIAAGQPITDLATTARELPSATEALQNLTRRFAEPGLIEELYQRTSESLALEATLTDLIEAAPANSTFWLARARARQQLGWRGGAVLDLTVAGNLAPEPPPGFDALLKILKETPVSVAAICQEWLDDEAADTLRHKRGADELAGRPVTEHAPALERAARAASRNRARHLYATSFTAKSEIRARALPLILAAHPTRPGFFPFVSPALLQQYEAELTAAGNDGARHIAIQQRYAALLGVTEGFWYRQITLLLGTSQNPAAFAATDIAGVMFPDAAWVKEARAKADPVKALPDSEKK